MTTYAPVTYTGDGTTASFSVPFEYLNRSDVIVSVAGVVTTAFVWTAPTTIRFAAAPANASTIVVKRVTGTNPVGNFAAGNLSADALNRAFKQCLFLYQEFLAGDPTPPAPPTGGVTTAEVQAALATAPLQMEAATSPYGCNADPGGSNNIVTSTLVTNSDSSPISGTERVTQVIINSSHGTGDGDVPGSTYAQELSAWKDNWAATTVPGQFGAQVIYARGGFHGTPSTHFTNAPTDTPPGLGYPYDPSGDVSGTQYNVFGSGGPKNATIMIEGQVGQQIDGIYDAAHLLSMDVQIGTFQQGVNPGVGVSLSANGGSLGAAFQAGNRVQGAAIPGTWGNFLRYSYDDGVHTPYEAFLVGQSGEIVLGGPFNSGSSDQKTIAVGRGAQNNLEVISSPATGKIVLVNIDDGGSVNAKGRIVGYGSVVPHTEASGATYLPTDLLNSVITRSGAGTVSDVIPSATDIVGDLSEAKIGNSFRFDIVNTNSGTLTITALTGITLAGVMTIQPNYTREFFAVVTALSPPAITIQGVKTSAI